MRRERTIDEVACQIREALSNDGQGEATARRLAFSFVEEFDRAGASDRLAMVTERPMPTSDPRYDALLAGLVEHLCARWEVAIPAWVEDPERFIVPWWFVSGLKRLHAAALAESPISLARRGVFLTANALSYA